MSLTALTGWIPPDYDRQVSLRAGFRRDQIRRNLAGRTITERDRILDSLERYVAPLASDEVTRQHIEAWLDSLTLTPRSRACYISTVHMFYRWAVEEGLRADDPTLRIRRPRLPRLVPRPISDDLLEKAIRNAGPRMRAWLALAAYQGFRCKEISQLRREDILDNRDPAVILVGEGKGGHQAVLPLNPEVLTALRLAGLPKRGYVFTSTTGRRFQPRTVSIYGNRYLHDMGIDETMHQLRHRFGTAVWAATKDLRVTQELLRHSSPATTAGYAAFDQELAREAVAQIHRIRV